MSDSTGKIHAAKIENSPRLQRVYELLLSGPKTTREIVRQADVCAVNSIAKELRENGINVECKPIRKGVFQYRLVDLF